MNWNNAANGPQLNGRLLFAGNRPFRATRYNLLSQPPFNKPDEESASIFNLNDDKKHSLFGSSLEGETDYRSKLNALKYQALLEQMINEPVARLAASRIERPANGEPEEKLLLNEKVNDFKSLFNRPLAEDEIINRKTRSEQSIKQRQPLDEYQQSKLLNFLNRDLFHAFRRNLYAKGEDAAQSHEVVELNSRPEKKTVGDDLSGGESNKNRASAKDGLSKEQDDKSGKQPNSGNYLPLIEQSGLSKPSSSLSSPLRKNKWNRVSKSAGSFRRSNVSDCIKVGACKELLTDSVNRLNRLKTKSSILFLSRTA